MSYSTADYYQEYCSSLKHLWTKYLEHEAVMESNFAGPQGKDQGKEHFGFEVDDARIASEDRVLFWCYENEVEVHHCSDECREDHSMTHENCLKYLAQLPRPWYSFTNGAINA